MRAFIVGFFLTVASGWASAAYDYGRWMCNWCELAPVGTPVGVMNLEKVIEFIKYENDSIMNSGPLKTLQLRDGYRTTPSPFAMEIFVLQ